MTVDSSGESLSGFDTSDDLDAFSKDLFGHKSATADLAENPQEEVEEPIEEAEDPSTNEPVDDADDTEPSEEEAPDGDAKPKKKTAQDRIKELTAQRHAAEREVNALKVANESRIAELERKLQEFANKAPQPKNGTAADGSPDPLAENEDGSLKYNLGEFDPQYIRDLAKFTVRQENEAAQAYRKQAEQEAAVVAARDEARSGWNAKLEEAHEEMPDIVDKIASLDAVVGSVDMNYQQYLVDVVMSLDNGPRVMAYLADNPDLAQKIVSSGAASATVALGRLDGKMAKPPVEKKTPTQAPKPAARITRGTSGQFSTRADTDDLDAFAKEFYRK